MKRFVQVSLVLTAMMVLFTSCNPYNKMQKKTDAIEVSSNPEVLKLTGNSVNADVTIKFPPKYLYEDAVIKVTPVLVFDGGEIEGTPKYYQGERVKGNYTVVDYRKGGTFVQRVSFPYDRRASLSTLEMRVEGPQGNKCNKKKHVAFVPYAAMATAQGISAVQTLADRPYTILMPDNFRRVTTITEEADIHYLINSSNVRKAELTQEQVKLFEEFVREYSVQADANMSKVYAKGYASPDGPENFNEKLSAERSRSGEKAMQDALSGVKVQYDAAAYGEDWEGFKKLVEESDMKDKDLILQVLSMYNSPVQREQEIKNMSRVFQELKTEILPQLRRTQFVASAEIEGRSDAQILAAVNKGEKDLTVEEILHAATLVDKCEDKAKIYKMAADRYNDVRAHNNYAVTLLNCGDVKGAKAAIEKAAKIESNPTVTNNMAAIAMAEGDLATAKRYLSALNSPEANQNKALIAFWEGDYATANKGLTGHNLAVMEVMNGDYAKAKAAISGSKDAEDDYLRAVIAMRENDHRAAIANLNTAISKKPELLQRAQNDVEFAKLFGTQEFMAL